MFRSRHFRTILRHPLVLLPSSLAEETERYAPCIKVTARIEKARKSPVSKSTFLPVFHQLEELEGSFPAVYKGRYIASMYLQVRLLRAAEFLWLNAKRRFAFRQSSAVE
jgi:hypothetical protein